MTLNHEIAPSAPRHEAMWPRDLFAAGVGWVLLARFKSGGQRVEVGIFLVDVFCLGVKFALYEMTDAADYRRRIRDHYANEFPMEEVSPACARKLVEAAVDYAAGLGFVPHSGFRKAARVFGGVAATACSQSFVFGHQGKPFYARGPRETEAEARRIVEHLHRRCGEGRFHFAVPLGEAEDITRVFGP